MVISYKLYLQVQKLEKKSVPALQTINCWEEFGQDTIWNQWYPIFMNNKKKSFTLLVDYVKFTSLWLVVMLAVVCCLLEYIYSKKR